MSFSQFFKNVELISELVAHVKSRINSQTEIRIWDAGCGMCQSTYTMAILLAESIGLQAYSDKITIIASDLDELRTFKSSVKTGIYPKNNLATMPESLIDKYFIENNAQYQVLEVIRSKVEFKRHDLLTYKSVGTDFDAMICVNVLHHFSAIEQGKVLDMFNKSLNAEGKLFKI
jgi:chemotaxis methyl-accepting protein methylase